MSADYVAARPSEARFLADLLFSAGWVTKQEADEYYEGLVYMANHRQPDGERQRILELIDNTLDRVGEGLILQQRNSTDPLTSFVGQE